MSGVAGGVRPNRALLAAREAKGYSQRRLAAHARQEGLRLGLAAPELDAICKGISRLERGVTVRPGEDFYLPALCAALGMSPIALFGEPTAGPISSSGWELTSRKFLPIYIGADCAQELAADHRWRERGCEWMTALALEVPYAGETCTCTLTLFEFGVLVAEIEEVVPFCSIAEVAVWRKASYITAREQVTQLVRDHFPAVAASPAYVLSTFCVTEPYWHGEDLHTAMQMLCAPGVLLDRHRGDPPATLLAAAEIAERVCFRDGFNRPDIVPFGIHGIAIGYASWAGVSYLPLAPARAIPAAELACFETVVQALWCYTHMIAGVIEEGRDPVIPDAFGWRFVRACQSRLTAARPRETGQQRMMRDAILHTSRLTTQLVDAGAILRDLAPAQRTAVPR